MKFKKKEPSLSERLKNLFDLIDELNQTKIFSDCDRELLITKLTQTRNYYTHGNSKDKYPKIYKKVEQRLETGWETTIALIQQGIHEGTVRPIQIPILKTMMEATLEQFFQRDILITNQISYNEALEEVVNILVDGITR